MAEAAAGLDLYRRLAAASVRSRAQYRLSFVLDLITAFGATVGDFLAIAVIFTHLPRLSGWTLYEVAFLYGCAGISFGITDMLMGQLDNFSEHIRRGTFDIFLGRPLGTLFQVTASEFAIRRLGKIAQAGAVLAFALANLHIAWSPARLAMLAVMIPAGTAIFAGIWIGFATMGFWTTQINEVTNAFTYGGNFVASYPITVLGPWLRNLLAFVIPMAFVTYYPSLFVLGKPDPLGGPWWLSLASPAVGALTLVVAGGLWQVGVRHYRSTGS